MGMPGSSQRGKSAMAEMKTFGFSSKVTKSVLKSLLNASENNWDYIENDNYSALVDAILAYESQPPETGHEEVAEASPEPPQYQTRMKVKREDNRPSPSTQSPDAPGGSLQKRPRAESAVPSEPHPQRSRIEPLSSPHSSRQKEAELLVTKPSFIKKTAEAGPSPSPRRTESAEPAREKAMTLMYRRDKQPVSERMDNSAFFKEPKIEPGLDVLPNSSATGGVTAPSRLEDKPCHSDSPQIEVPLAVIHPPAPPPSASAVASATSTRTLQICGRQGLSARNANTGQTNVSQKEKEKGSLPVAECSNGTTTHDLAHVQQASSTNIDIASSSSGEVKISFACCTDRPDFKMPSLEQVLKAVEDRCLKSYKFLPPDFNLMTVMKEMCQSVLDLGSESAMDKESIVNVTPILDSLRKPRLHGMLGCSLNGSVNLPVLQGLGMPPLSAYPLNQDFKANKENARNGKLEECRDPEAANGVSNSLVVVQPQQLVLGVVRPLHDANDISKGEERVRIPLANNSNGEKLPSSFYYIPNNIVYQNAYLNFSLARIGDEDCCSDCFGDCMAAPIPCACARETGGEFAYTLDGLIKKKFLDECISMNRNPEKHSLFYCKKCPLERIKNGDTPDSCKGHLIRKFVKECWSKCGCNKQCGNRVVQRGITCNLEVFFTGEGKGWGVRTLDDLPRGAFVCEYVGEILTNMELYDRTLQTTGNARHTYPVLLDADWGSEGVLKDEEALCLDATFYGNVARFVNHRCHDANLVEIPVEVETPDRHYYHLAFFTTRKIEAFEELTWDYGIDFDDDKHPIKAFGCHCRSKHCRDSKRTKNRSRKRIDGASV